VSLGLSICGAVFINTALKALEETLVGYPRSELQAALTGLSGDFLSTLEPAQKTAALDIIVSSLAKT
jgi:hypothetical protein